MELVHQKGTGTRATTTTNRGGSILEWTRVCPNFLSTPCSSRHSKLFKQSDSISTCKWHVDPLTLRTLSQVQICQEILHTLCLNCTSSWASLPRKEVGSGRKRSINHSEEALTCFFFCSYAGMTPGSTFVAKTFSPCWWKSVSIKNRVRLYLSIVAKMILRFLAHLLPSKVELIVVCLQDIRG